MRSLLPALLLSSLPMIAAAAQPDDILPFAHAERTLPNGLRVIVVPTGFPNIVSVQIPVQTGSRNEVEAGKSGFAHFFEHMMFRGTPAYPTQKYQALMTRAGARSNAFTTDDFTNYHTTFAKEDLEKILEIEADRFQNLDYPVEAFKTESRAVLGSGGMRGRMGVSMAGLLVVSGALHCAVVRVCGRGQNFHVSAEVARWRDSPHAAETTGGPSNQRRMDSDDISVS